MRIENKKALASARFPGPVASRTSHPIVTVCQHCPGGETIAEPILFPIEEGLDEAQIASVVQANASRMADDMAARAKLETARTFKTRKAWREHCATTHAEAK